MKTVSCRLSSLPILENTLKKLKHPILKNFIGYEKKKKKKSNSNSNEEILRNFITVKIIQL